jgi:hypothetical protein
MNLEPVKYPSVLTPGAIEAFDDYEAGAHSGSWSIGDDRCNRAYTLVLKVFTSDKMVGPVQIMSSLNITLGQTYQFPATGGSPTENDTGSFLQSIRCDLDSEDGLQWKVTLEYGPLDVNHQLGTSVINQGLINPTERYPEVYWSKAKYDHYKPYDETPEADDGPLPYVNTVGDPLLNPPKTEETRPTLKFIRNESTYNDAYASQFKDAVNADEFLGYPPNTAKCSDISGERIYDPDWGNYFRVTYEFEFRDDDDGKGYTLEILNAGYRQLVNGTGSPVNVVDANGQTVTDAVPLQQNGAYVPGTNSTPYYIPFQEFPAVEFSDLNIPDDVLDANE